MSSRDVPPRASRRLNRNNPGLAQCVARAAKPDLAKALAQLGLPYDEGAEYDEKTIAERFEQAAEAGNRDAQRWMALFCAFGFGGRRNLELATDWMEKAAEVDRGQAYYLLAIQLTETDVFEADVPRAVALLKNSAAAHCPEGILALARHYQDSGPVKRAEKKAERLYKAVADRFLEAAQALKGPQDPGPIAPLAELPPPAVVPGVAAALPAPGAVPPADLPADVHAADAADAAPPAPARVAPAPVAPAEADPKPAPVVTFVPSRAEAKAVPAVVVNCSSDGDAKAEAKLSSDDVVLLGGIPEHVLEQMAELQGEDIEPEERYAPHILAHYRAIEGKRHLKANFLERQKEVTPQVRQTIVDWLGKLTLKFHTSRETYFLAVHIVDRFLSKRLCKLDKMQLIGITALLIACKYEETRVPQIKDLIAMCDDKSCTKESVIALETIILQELKFSITVPSPIRFAERFLAIAEATPQQRYLALCFIEMAYMNTNFLRQLPSKLGAGAVYLALYSTKAPNLKQLWPQVVQPEALYSEADLAQLIREIWAFVTTPNPYNLNTIRDKWATERFMSVSVVVPLNKSAENKSDGQQTQVPDGQAGQGKEEDALVKPVPAEEKAPARSAALPGDLMSKAEQGDADVQYTVGLHYADGTGVERDLDRALTWYQKAAASGHPGALAAMMCAPEHRLDYGDVMEDNFIDAGRKPSGRYKTLHQWLAVPSAEWSSREVLLFHAGDRLLQEMVEQTAGMLAGVSNERTRYNILFLAVSERVGGRLVDDRYDVGQINDGAIKKLMQERGSCVVPIGMLFGKPGMCRHRALLLKYLGDRLNERLGEPCFQIGVVRGCYGGPNGWHAWNVVRMGGKDFVADLMTHDFAPVPLEEAHGYEPHVV